MNAPRGKAEKVSLQIRQRVPIRTARDLDCPVPGLLEAMDGFTPAGRVAPR